MLKTIQAIVLAALCLNFNAKAQSPNKTCQLKSRQYIHLKLITIKK